jgi:hypothetical protein
MRRALGRKRLCALQISIAGRRLSSAVLDQKQLADLTFPIGLMHGGPGKGRGVFS